MKKIFALSTIILLLLVSGCGEQRTNPAADINTFCNAYLHMDEDSLAKIGLNKYEADQTFIKPVVEIFNNSDEVEFNFALEIDISSALQRFFKRTNFECAVVSENGDNATVKITLTEFNALTQAYFLSNVQGDIFEIAQKSKSEVIADALIAALDGRQAVGTSEMTVECKYNSAKKMWEPADLEAFKKHLSGQILNFQ